MNSTELTRAILIKLWRSKLVILLTGIIIAILMFFYAYKSTVSYTSRASVFPLNTQTANPLGGAGVAAVLGIGDPTQSFGGSEASINIIELALSRNVREAVAAERLKSFENKTIAALLINAQNKKLGIFDSKSDIPTDSVALITFGGSLLQSAISAKINKNGVLELGFTCNEKALVQPVSEVIIEKISHFYINLRIQKAKEDYTFTVQKIDSLNRIVTGYDKRAIGMQNSTMFTPQDKLEYIIPKENLGEDRERIKAQRNAAIANRDEALWRLQKETPIVATLDKPDPPFSVDRKSKVVWTIIGFFLGVIGATIFSVAGILSKYTKGEVRRLIHEN